MIGAAQSIDPPAPSSKGCATDSAVGAGKRDSGLMADSLDLELWQLVSLLSPTLGFQRSRVVVEEAMRSIAATPKDHRRNPIEEVLEHLAPLHGLVGAAARIAQKNASAHAPQRASLPTAPTSVFLQAAPAAPQAKSERAIGRSTARTDGARACGFAACGSRCLVETLAPSLGRDKAMTSLAKACLDIGIGPEGAPERADEILSHLAKQPGPVGITARFVRARLRG